MRTLLILICCMNQLFAQDLSVEKRLFDQYEKYRETSISDRRFKHVDIQSLLLKLKNYPQFQVKTLGQSIEGRNISLVSIGEGKTNVLLWSQMHGDEPTATMALMDVFNFFKEKGDFEDVKLLLKKELTLHFIPMLNPDGAERFQRRNALGVDLNRDALRLQNPESRILKRVRDSLNAVWGFNLHDQNRYYAAGRNPQTASISFLAPAYNFEKDINKVRGNAMRLIGVMNNVLQQYIPGKVARYNDDFEPRAFGDNITKWGTSTILIESGGLVNDREKQLLRKLHFVILLSSFQAIANKSFQKSPIESYNKIPFNDSNAFHDLILREAKVELYQHTYTIDIAFRRNEVDYDHHDQFYFKSQIQDIGDLSTLHAYEEFDASDYKVVPGKIYPKKIENTQQLKNLNLINLLQQGFTDIQMENPPPARQTHQLPVRISKAEDTISNNIALGRNPSLFFKKDGQIRAVVVNGFLFDLVRDKEKIETAFKNLDFK